MAIASAPSLLNLKSSGLPESRPTHFPGSKRGSQQLRPSLRTPIFDSAARAGLIEFVVQCSDRAGPPSPPYYAYIEPTAFFFLHIDRCSPKKNPFVIPK